MKNTLRQAVLAILGIAGFFGAILGIAAVTPEGFDLDAMLASDYLMGWLAGGALIVMFVGWRIAQRIDSRHSK
jgi:hypothetical protein